MNDEWYSRCDILKLAETRPTKYDEPTLPGFILTQRLDDFDTGKESRGVLIFCKPDLDLLLHPAIIQKGPKYTDEQLF